MQHYTRLNNKKIILGITGSIATYKTPMLVRDLQKSGAEVKVIATESALHFASQLVLENLTHSPVIHSMFDHKLQQQGAWHIELAHWCDLLLIAPCSATTLSKLATGNADNPVSLVALALPSYKPLVVAPAMDFTMYEHPATQSNINTIINRGGKIIEPATGELASGLQGKGRLPDSDVLLREVNAIFDSIATAPLQGKNILITAGATREKIDDVRFISNHSSGRMGFALAQVATELGAEVTLIAGNTTVATPNVQQFIRVASAAEMFEAVQQHYAKQSVIIMAAAVSDYTPIDVFDGKIKKSNNISKMKLKPTDDILQWLGNNIEHDKTKLVGFALESTNHLKNAIKKLNKKHCDIMVLNSVHGVDSGFDKDNNTIVIISKNKKPQEYPPMSKYECAKEILKQVF